MRTGGPRSASNLPPVRMKKMGRNKNLESNARPSDEPMPALTRASLFLAFLEIGLCGFGGVAPWARRVIVEKRQWLSERDYAELLGISSILPGANTVNIAVLLGDRTCGVSGSLCALAGLLVMPLTILVALAVIYDRVSGLSDVKNALAGAAAATAGLAIGTAAKMMRNLRPDMIGLAAGIGVFVAAGLLHISLLWTLAVAAPASMIVLAVGARRT
jgi:chromate transporter